MLKVFKFGGASVKDAAAVKNAAAIVKQFSDDSLLVVVSAMGKTTNALERLADAFFYKKENYSIALQHGKEAIALIEGLKSVDYQTTADVYETVGNIYAENAASYPLAIEYFE